MRLDGLLESNQEEMTQVYTSVTEKLVAEVVFILLDSRDRNLIELMDSLQFHPCWQENLAGKTPVALPSNVHIGDIFAINEFYCIDVWCVE